MQNPVQPALALSDETRNELITDLTYLSTILRGNKPIPKKDENKTVDIIKYCVQSLIDLSPVKSKESAGLFDQLTFKISGAERLLIVNHLISIENALVLDPIDDETKRDLIARNERIVRLLKRPYKEQSIRSEEGAYENVKSGVSGLNEEPDWKAAIKQMKASLEAKMDELKVELKREIQKGDANWADWVTFKFEITRVVLIIFKCGEEVSSKRFCCGGLEWSLSAQRYEDDKDRSKYLSLYLQCHGDDKSKWYCKATFDLILYNRLPKGQNYVKQTVHTFDDSQRSGYSFFISEAVLIDPKKGYIDYGDIKLGVKLKAGPLVKKVD